MRKRTTRQKAMRACKENQLFSESPLCLVGAYLNEGTSIKDALLEQYKVIDFHEEVIRLLEDIETEEEE